MRKVFYAATALFLVSFSVSEARAQGCAWRGPFACVADYAAGGVTSRSLAVGCFSSCGTQVADCKALAEAYCKNVKELHTGHGGPDPRVACRVGSYTIRYRPRVPDSTQFNTTVCNIKSYCKALGL